MVVYTGYVIVVFHVLNKYYGHSEPYPKPWKFFSYRSVAQVRIAVALEVLK